MPFLLAILIGLWASVANADFYTGVLQQQAQQVAAPAGLDCSTATCNETFISSAAEFTTWEEATDIDLTSPCKIEVGTITADLSLGAAQLSMGGATPNSTCYRVLRGASSLGNIGAAANIKVTCGLNNEACIKTQEDYAIFEDLEIENTAGTNAWGLNMSGGSNVIANRVISKAATGNAFTGVSGKIFNSIATGSLRGIAVLNFSTAIGANITFVSNQYSITFGGTSSGINLKNSVFYNSSVTDTHTGGTCVSDSSNNATTSASASATCDSADPTWVFDVVAGDFVDAAGGDFTPDTATLLDQGADNILTSFARADWPFGTDTINADLKGTDRGTTDWDIGAVEGN